MTGARTALHGARLTHTHTHSMLKMVTIFMSVMSPISHVSRCRPGHNVHTSLYTVSCGWALCVVGPSVWLGPLCGWVLCMVGSSM